MLYKPERKVMLQQYDHAIERQIEIGVITEFDHLVIVELRAHAQDALRHHQGADMRSLICFAPLALRTYNLRAIRVSPSFRFAAQSTQSTETSDKWICLPSHHEHA